MASWWQFGSGQKDPSAPKAMVGRIDGKQYCALPEPLKNALVIGMLDMLEALPTYASEHDRKVIGPLLNYSRGRDTGDLRKALDEYVAAEPGRQQYMMAGNFLGMLIEKTRR
jgi:hypothetical protein